MSNREQGGKEREDYL